MNENDRTTLISNIINIYDKNTGNIIHIDNIQCIYQTCKFSSTKVPLYKIKLNNVIISKHSNYNVEYKCILCNQTNIVNLSNLSRKINKIKIKQVAINV